MFKFLKDKLKGALSKISRKVDEEAQEEIVEKPIEESIEEGKKEVKELKKDQGKLEEKRHDLEKEERKLEAEEKKLVKEKKKHHDMAAEVKVAEDEIKDIVKEKVSGYSQKQKEKQKEKEIVKEIKEIKKKEEKIEKKIEKVEKEEQEVEENIEDKEIRIEPVEKIEEKKQDEKKGFFHKLTERVSMKKIDEKQFDDLFWNLEVVLMENNVAVEVIEKIKDDLKRELVEKPIKRGKIESTIEATLKKSLEDLFPAESFSLDKKIKEKKDKPMVICFVGVNGSGKTTTIAKVAHFLKKRGITCVLAAADTFRAAAIDQLQLHADKLDVKLIKHDYGSDAAAVAFDAVKHAKAKGIDVVLIDTAGRMHANVNLMDEMKKIVRVAKPDLNIFVGESITGNDCVEQAKKFDETVGIKGIILTKADVDEKGGAAVSVSYVTKQPILFLGMGQEYDDLKEFHPDLILDNVGL